MLFGHRKTGVEKKVIKLTSYGSLKLAQKDSKWSSKHLQMAVSLKDAHSLPL